MKNLIIQPTAALGEMSRISSNQPTTPDPGVITATIGLAGKMSNNIYRVIARFNIAQIKPEDVIISATYYLHNGSSFTLSSEEGKVRRCTKAWTEAGGCWNYWVGTTAWDTPGGDFVTDDESTFMIPTNLDPGAGWEWLKIDIKALAVDAQKNRGGILNMILMKTSEVAPNCTFAPFSDDWTVASETPKVDILYITGRSRRPRRLRVHMHVRPTTDRPSSARSDES